MVREMLLDVPKDTPEECLKDMEFALLGGGLHNTHNRPAKKGCPGYVPNQNMEYGFYTMGPHTFKIPRAYMWQGRFRPDGEVESLYLLFQYPDMTPGDANLLTKDSHHQVRVTLRYPKNECVSKADGRCISHPQARYENEIEKRSEYLHIDFEQSTFHPELNLSSVSRKWITPQNTISQWHDIFYRGDPREPEYWLTCAVKYREGTIPFCKGSFYLTGKVIVDYRFRRDLLTDHQLIREKIINKTKEFQGNKK